MMTAGIMARQRNAENKRGRTLRLLNAMMRRFVQTGTLRIIDADGHEHVHEGLAGPRVTVRLADRKLYRTLAFNPELRAGEAYVEGTLAVEEGSIRDLLMIFALNRDNLRAQPWQKFVRKAQKRMRNLAPRNAERRARANVAHHYDLSNDLYRLFLDSDMNYSCGYFATPDVSLEDAQRAKLRHIAAKLDLRPGQHILDIGSGWGGMACYLAEVADVAVTGVTLSADQHALATERALERGLKDRVRFELKDYRDANGRFDRIVSVGMFEHVGIGQHREFFEKIASLLTDDGVALLHSIGRMGAPGATSPWIRKYIFPGAHVPALSEMLASVEKARLWVGDLEVWRRHYAETLLHWDRRFQKERARVAQMFDGNYPGLIGPSVCM